MMKKIPLIAIILLSLLGTPTTSQCDDVSFAPFSVDLAASASLREGDWSEALRQLLVQPVPGDSLFRSFKLAVTYYRLENYSSALSLLQKVLEQNPSTAPVVYVHIAQIEHRLERTGNALAAYRAALRADISARFRHYIYEKLREIVESDTTITMDDAPWLEEYYRWLAPVLMVETMTNIDTIEGYIKEARWGTIDSFLLNMPPSGKDACRIAKSIRAADDWQEISVASLYWCARSARSCRELTIAKQFLDAVMKRPRHVDSLSARQLLLFTAELHENREEWPAAISSYKKYINSFGENPDVLMSIARAYRKINRQRESTRWYDRLTRAYPKNPKSQEVIWLRAWNHEDDGRFDLAAQQYRLIISRFGKGPRLDESYLRLALCLYRRSLHDSARAVLETFINKIPDSPHFAAGYFWQAKSFLASGKRDDAMMVLRMLSRREPFNYYAHRARQLLAQMGDTTPLIIDTTFDRARTLAWFDSAGRVSIGKQTLVSADSAALLNGLLLASVGDLEKADLFLEPLELGFPGNLPLQYELARLYIALDASTEAYRIARRLTWRIPQQFRCDMPLDVYTLFYPPFYSDRILAEADRYDIDPLFISGLIRQESTFNPQIVSPAGAVGLMQIMPYTGKYLAEKTGCDFSVDSLYSPQYNIRLGVYYVHELLGEFEGSQVLALAAYNAGPHNAKRWKKQNREDEFDLFVEDIGFTETRNYVKKVMGNYWSYRFLDENTSYSYSKGRGR